MEQERFVERRTQYMEQLGDAIAIVSAGRLQTRNDDVDHDFRQDSNFFFLTGFSEPGAIAVFDPAHETEQYTLFVRKRDPDMEAWNGRRAGTHGALETYGADAAHVVEDFGLWLKNRLLGRTDIHYALGGSNDSTVLSAISSARAYSLRSGAISPSSMTDPSSILSEMRLFKAPAEVEALRQACHISATAHTEVMRFTRPGMNERQVQAAIEYMFAVNGSQRVGYGSIIAGGDNATILHYVENNQDLRDGDLVLIDAAAEYDHFTADITRTFPINGTFTAPQRALYELTLTAERDVIKMCTPGLPFADMHTKAVKILSHGLVEIGLLPGSVDEAIEKGWYRQFFFHGTGHWLGMDVHDAGAYKRDREPRKLEPSMCFTVEPGLYVAPEKEVLSLSHASYDATGAFALSYEIGADEAKAEMAKVDEAAGFVEFTVPAEFIGLGVRIEDNILITESGHDNMSQEAPVDPGDIETICQQESSLSLPDLP